MSAYLDSDVMRKPSSQGLLALSDIALARSFEMRTRKILNNHKLLLNKVFIKATLDALVLNLNCKNKMLKQEIS